MRKNALPEKTVERLSQYRRTLLEALAEGELHIYSHEIASKLNITPVQVRRDIMLIGHKGTLRKGYDIKDLIDLIGKIIDTKLGQNVAVVGMGNLGRAITAYFNGKRSKLNIVATFDVDPNKVNRIISGVRCHHIDKLAEIIKAENISIAVLTTPPDKAKDTAEILVMGGIKGILNYTSTTVNVSPHVFLEEYDMVTSLEKVAFYVKEMQ